jgi:hypothetical protein
MAFQVNAFQNHIFIGAHIKGFQVETVPSIVPGEGGGAGFVHVFTRRRWKELLAVMEAEARAIADIEGNRTPTQQEKLYDAVAATNRAIMAAYDQAATAKINEEMQRLANSLDAAFGATRVTASIKNANAAIAAANVIIAHYREQEEEEMQMVFLLVD